MYFRWGDISLFFLSFKERPTIIYEENLNSVIEELKTNLEAEYQTIGEGLNDSWGASQTTYALIGISSMNDFSKYLDFIYADADSVDYSWNYIFNKELDYHIGLTAWNLLTLAELDSNVNFNYFKSLLDKQHQDGYWTVYPTTQKNKASVYATCYSLKALIKALKTQGL